MFRTVFLLVLSVIGVSVRASDLLSLKGIADGDFRSAGLEEVTPIGSGDVYAQISSDGRRIVEMSFRTGSQTGVLLDLDSVRLAGGGKLDRIDGFVVSPKCDKLLVCGNSRGIYRRSAVGDWYLYYLSGSRLVALDGEGCQQEPIFSPDGNLVAFVRANNIYLVKLLYENALSQVTTDGERGKVINGIPDWVYEEEFSTSCSMVFTSDSKQLCWVRYDESDVREYTIPMYKGLSPSIEDNAVYPGSFSYKYPKAGELNSRVSVRSFDIKSRQTRELQVPLDEDGYIPRIEATSDASKLAVFTLNRGQDVLRIYMVNPLSTESKLSIQEKSEKYIKEESVTGSRITGDGILLLSDRDGWSHLYLYSLTGQLRRRITEGSYEVKDVYGYDDETGDCYYSSNERGTGEKQVYVSHSNGKKECLTDKSGFNTAIFSGNYKYFINTWSDMDTPPVWSIRSVKGKELAVLEDNSALRAKLSGYGLGSKELFELRTSEGVDLKGWMVKPRDFDSGKRYPVIMYQYGGPGNQQVQNRWSIGGMGQGAIFEQYMAQEGYIVVCVDGRGTGGRGSEFEKCTYMRLGEKESADQVEVALWLGKQSYVDGERIGIWGWSYGGWNTLMSMSEGRAVFRAGVAVAPPTSWRYYDTVYTERYMRTPKENKSGYDDVNPIARAKDLSGDLLLIHGMADDNVHFQNSVEYAEALVQADKDFKEVFYSNRNHGIAGGNTRNHLLRQIMDWFGEKMK